MISFVIPAYNEEKNIRMCIIACADEGKRHGSFEIIVVNNNSNDGTVQAVRSIRDSFPWMNVTLIYENRKGVMYARQAGYKVAKGGLIANIDADNWLPEGWLAYAIQRFNNDPKLVLLSGPIRYHSFGPELTFLTKVFYTAGGVAGRVIGPMSQGGNSIFRKSALDAVGGFNTNIDFYGDDTDIARRLAKVGKVRFSNKLWSWGSDRRFREEGVITTTYRYIANYLSVSLLNRPIHKTHRDIRP